MAAKRSLELENFNSAMDSLLRADPKAVREEMEAEKRANAKKRKTKRKPPASGRASTATD